MNSRRVIPNKHFSRFTVRPLSLSRRIVARKARSCVSCVSPYTIMSSEIFCAPSIPAKATAISCWYCSLADVTPNISLLYRYNPLWVANVVISRDSGSSSIWWYPHFKSIFENTLAPFIFSSTSSTVGIGYQPRSMDLLASRISKQIRTSPSDFGTITTGLSHGVGPSTGSIMSCSNNCHTFLSIFGRIWNGCLFMWHATGFTSLFRWMVTFRSFNTNVSAAHLGYWRRISSPCSDTALISYLILSTLRFKAVCLPSNGNPLLLITVKSALVLLFPARTSQWKMPFTSRGLSLA